jgi:hypothetical protein
MADAARFAQSATGQRHHALTDPTWQGPFHFVVLADPQLGLYHKARKADPIIPSNSSPMPLIDDPMPLIDDPIPSISLSPPLLPSRA